MVPYFKNSKEVFTFKDLILVPLKDAQPTSLFQHVVSTALFNWLLTKSDPT